MAKLEHTLNGNFNQWLSRIEDGILNGSMSASLEDSSDFRSGDARCSVRVFERYSYSGGNRLSLHVTVIEKDNIVDIIGISSGGSNGLFFKVNTWGEDAFLEKLKEAIKKL